MLCRQKIIRGNFGKVYMFVLRIHFGSDRRMTQRNLKVFLFIVLLFDPYVVSIAPAELVSTGVAVGSALIASSFLAGYEYFKCQWYECCSEQWITGNMASLRQQLDTRLYGQHLVLDTVVPAIRSHMNNPNPKKALVMSFHGWTGGGKNYVSQMIADSVYKRGGKSAFVHLFSSTLHFAHEDEAVTYKKQLHEWIQGNITKCTRSLFIFDEIDKMPDGVMDAIKPFIDYSYVKGVDFRKSIFLFLSNTGGNDITKRVLEHYSRGDRRENIKLKEMEDIISQAAYNEKGGLQFSRLISSYLIDHFVPFLPLEKEHIRGCIRDYFVSRNVTRPSEDSITAVANMLQYYPKHQPIYSISGCKRIEKKVDLYFEENMVDEDDNPFSLQTNRLKHRMDEL